MATARMSDTISISYIGTLKPDRDLSFDGIEGEKNSRTSFDEYEDEAAIVLLEMIEKESC